jgi:hypothetical protein
MDDQVVVPMTALEVVLVEHDRPKDSLEILEEVLLRAPFRVEAAFLREAEVFCLKTEAAGQGEDVVVVEEDLELVVMVLLRQAM